jgi:hypothetical protein
VINITTFSNTTSSHEIVCALPSLPPWQLIKEVAEGVFSGAVALVDVVANHPIVKAVLKPAVMGCQIGSVITIPQNVSKIAQIVEEDVLSAAEKVSYSAASLGAVVGASRMVVDGVFRLAQVTGPALKVLPGLSVVGLLCDVTSLYRAQSKLKRAMHCEDMLKSGQTDCKKLGQLLMTKEIELLDALMFPAKSQEAVRDAIAELFVAGSPEARKEAVQRLQARAGRVVVSEKVGLALAILGIGVGVLFLVSGFGSKLPSSALLGNVALGGLAVSMTGAFGKIIYDYKTTKNPAYQIE